LVEAISTSPFQDKKTGKDVGRYSFRIGNTWISGFGPVPSDIVQAEREHRKVNVAVKVNGKFTNYDRLLSTTSAPVQAYVSPKTPESLLREIDASVGRSSFTGADQVDIVGCVGGEINRVYVEALKVFEAHHKHPPQSDGEFRAFTALFMAMLANRNVSEWMNESGFHLIGEKK
jgi:hypothetical protein